MTAAMILALIGVAAGTFVSEDATAVAAGVAVRDGHFTLLPALLACGLGIYVGDLGLWAIGRYAGRRVLTCRRLAAHLKSIDTLGAWIDRRPALAILGSRFLPGTRLPLYVAAGLSGRRTAAFLGWALVAVVLWTPLIVGSGVVLGAATVPLPGWAGGTWTVRALLALALIVSARRVSRVNWRRWEFWPAWVFNAPIALWIVWLAIRHRSLTVFTCANPGIEDGGLVGESKSAILSSLPRDSVVPWLCLEAGDTASRLVAFHAAARVRGWTYPLVFKPDVGQRGTGVRWIENHAQALAYLDLERGRVLVQAPHPGPFEAGIFYVRFPHEEAGRIFSLTDKRFPVVNGDGVSTLEQLINNHDRFRLQSAVFLARLGVNRTRVPNKGERVSLGRAGNHCQGTEFLDGRWLVTPALERRIDVIARSVEGFYFGRFDVRYADRARFMAGEDLAIIELNGVTSEATHVYDPSGSLLKAWQTLMQQWSIAFAIGAANRRRGAQPASLGRIARLVWVFMRQTPAYPVAD